MAGYSIKDLENFTNIKAHTIRIWEQRYNLLEPQRSDTNIRTYSENDLKKILNINLLYSNGYKISKIAGFSESEIKEIATELLFVEKGNSNILVENFIQLILDLNEDVIEKRLLELLSEQGLHRLYIDVLIPLLKKIGDLWQVDALSVSHEHFFSNILRQFLIVQTGKINVPKQHKGNVILFLHEKEMHELSLLFYNYVIKSNGFDCYYLGQKVPLKDLELICKQLAPKYIVTSMINEISVEEMETLFKQISRFHPIHQFAVGGVQTKIINPQTMGKALIINSYEDILAKIV